MTDETQTPAPAPVAPAWAKGKKTAPAPVVAPVVEPEAPATPPVETQTPAPVAEGEVVVTVFVPKAFNLTLSPSHSIKVPAGVQDMTLDQANHWYSVANGVKIHNPSKA
jgi:hypothetical protein